MARIGLGDYSGFMPPAEFDERRYPQPYILVTPLSARGIERKYAIWGLYSTYKYMVESAGSFGWARFTLLVDGKDVAMIGFGPQNSADHAVGNSTDDTDKALKNTDKPKSISHYSTGSKQTTSSVKQFGMDTRLRLTLTYLGNEIDQDVVFSTIMWDLAQAAAPPGEEIITRAWSPAYQEESGCRFIVQAFARQTPPFFQFEWLVRAIGALADHIVLYEVYEGFSMTIELDGVLIGNGLLYVVRSQGVAVSGLQSS
ncbi:MAG: hypothetical protein Q9186_007471 [Xanthomendoza sp. 1 TL-2023]